ncbi:uncharacterized protein LOC142322953 [Lycorma delicatula]|uniref:uncharacterized protein LOC142322953 n=1 Tax=Lycorma delicatula TaxID=130591 RepID=UPI003F517670
MLSSFVSLALALFQMGRVSGHGRLMDPPARNSMWRFGFPNPVNYNDNELYCGGYAVQYQQNRGLCGVCGDRYDYESPRPHEAGGQFAKGIVTRHYTVGQNIDVEIELTANHWGRFELFLCPNNNPRYEATQSCLDRYPLYISGTREVRFLIPSDSKKKAIFRYKVRLPPYLTCTQCVLQWTYYTGNMWGKCANGTEAIGCGDPETFRNCADIAITTSTSGLPPSFVDNYKDNNPYLLYFKSALQPQKVHPLIIRATICIATPRYRVLPGIDDWCQTNCLRYPPNCPPEVCFCPDQCESVGELEGRDGADVWCQDQCIIYPPKCPANRCRCY